ncbi:hypothetical protein CDPW8_1742 [Corynebacterium diphtheriae PW8]|nr:hypothetical protein CDPW8_1742 [Corynebacterium diphtheriae PW8]
MFLWFFAGAPLFLRYLGFDLFDVLAAAGPCGFVASGAANWTTHMRFSLGFKQLIVDTLGGIT